jgi:hypothetical protein
MDDRQGRKEMLFNDLHIVFLQLSDSTLLLIKWIPFISSLKENGAQIEETIQATAFRAKFIFVISFFFLLALRVQDCQLCQRISYHL